MAFGVCTHKYISLTTHVHIPMKETRHYGRSIPGLKIHSNKVSTRITPSWLVLFDGISKLVAITCCCFINDTIIHCCAHTGKWIASIFTCSDAMDSSKVKQLLQCIQDSYVTNKMLAVELLNNLVSRDILVDYMNDLTGLAHSMMYGAKAADFTSSAYYVRLFMNVDSEKLSKVIGELNLKWINKVKQASKLHQDTLYSSVFISKCKEPPQQLVVLIELINFLQLQLSLAQDNLLRASVETPVYGILEVIRVSLEPVDLRYSGYMVKCNLYCSKSFYICVCIASI